MGNLRMVLRLIVLGLLTFCLVSMGEFINVSGFIIAAIGTPIVCLLGWFLFNRTDDAETIEETTQNFSEYGERIASSTSKIAIGGATVSNFTDKLTNMFSLQSTQTHQIAERVEQLEAGNVELLQATSHAQAAIDQSNQETQESNALLEQALAQQDVLDQQIQVSNNSLLVLKSKADAISNIVDTINSLADQTNMLALNAAIEAARAGEQGRGFAVVADEVRALAKKTTDATQGIESVLKEIETASEDSVRAIDDVAKSGEVMAELVANSSEKVKQNNDSSYTAKTAMEQVLQTVANHNETNRGITENVRSLSNNTETLERDLLQVSQKVLTLSHQTEDIFKQLNVFDLINRNSQVSEIALNAAKAVSELFEANIQNGSISESALFDNNYQPIAGTNPQKFSTAFDKFTDRVLPQLQEPLLSQHNFIIYAGAVDKQGYFPTHNKRFSKPLSGNYDTDLANNRTKRIFDDYTGKRCGTNTDVFLLQTYKRDTGEVMHDVSAPIFVNGRHWGGFRIGYQAQDD